MLFRLGRLVHSFRVGDPGLVRADGDHADIAEHRAAIGYDGQLGGASQAHAFRIHLAHEEGRTVAQDGRYSVGGTQGAPARIIGNDVRDAKSSCYTSVANYFVGVVARSAEKVLDRFSETNYSEKR